MAIYNRYGLTESTIQAATAYMVGEGYIDADTDIIGYTRSMVEDIDFMVKAKIRQWAAAYNANNQQSA